jgi:hypothetical protein
VKEHRSWKVVPDGERWMVRRAGADNFHSRHADQETALRAARIFAREYGPGHVIVHSEDGSVIWSEIVSCNGSSDEKQAAASDGHVAPTEFTDPTRGAARAS